MASKHYITLPSGKRVSLRSYARAWKTLAAMTPEERGSFHDPTWQWHQNSGNDILRAMRKGLHDRINQRGARI